MTDKRPGEASRVAENARLDRFLGEEKALWPYAVAFLRPSHFNDYVKRRLTQTASRGQEGGRGRYKPVEQAVKLRTDGMPRANAAAPKAPRSRRS